MWMGPDQSQIASKAAGAAKEWIPALGKTVISVVGSLGTVIAFAKTGFDLLQNRSLLAKRNSELERAGRYADLLEKFSCAQVAKEHQEALGESVQSCLQQCLANVARLNARLAELNRDPNSHLRVHEKLFLMFRPVNWRGWALLALAYAVLWLCGWYIFHTGAAKGGHFSRQEFLTAWQDSFTYLLLAFFVVVAMVLRAWALEERRRCLNFRTDAGRLGRWLVMRFPESGRMLLAQTMFFWAGMVLLMIVHGGVTDAYKNGGSDVGSFIFFGMIALAWTVILRAWALAELAYQQRKPQLVRLREALFTRFFKNLRQYALWRVMFVMSCAWCSGVLLIALLVALILIGNPGAAALVLVVIPLPSLVLTYAILRSLRIKYSLAEGIQEQQRGAVALEATA